jgi:hypothetical protein
MVVPSFTVTTVTAVTTKRDIPPLEVTQCCAGCPTVYVCNAVGGIAQKPVTAVTVVTEKPWSGFWSTRRAHRGCA